MEHSYTVEELIQLMQRAKNGDKPAFEQVYNHFFKPIFRYLLRRTKNTKDAEDLTQQVFLRLYISNSIFTDRDRGPLAYLFTVARNLANDFYNKHRSLLSLEENDIPEPHELEKTVELNQTIAGGLAELASDQREVIEAKFRQGLTTHEIAVKLNKTEAAIRQIQCRALRQLRDYLQS